jgi:DNA-binding Lrp family transcriptional regulator
MEVVKILKKKDLLIMSYLRNNARETLTRISRKTSIPVSTIYDKLKMHEGGIIQKHVSLLDFNRLGFNTRANVMIKVGKEIRKDIKEYMLKNHNINNVYKINNGYDFMVEVVFRHIKDLEDFLENLESKFDIKSKSVYYIVEDVKRETFMNDPAILSLMGA